MKRVLPCRLALIAAAAACLAGCGKIREKAADHYLSQAERVLALPEPSREELIKAYADTAKSLRYRPDSERAIESLKALTEKAGRTGFAEGPDQEIAILKDVLRSSPLNWPAYTSAVDALSARGDLYSLNELAGSLEKAGGSEGASGRVYDISAALAVCYSAMVPWIESEGYLSLNKSPELLVEKTAEYVRVRRRAEELWAYLAKEDGSDPLRRKKLPEALSASSELAFAELAAGATEAERVYSSAARMVSEPDFLNAVKLTVQGNGALLKKDYSEARALYSSAMRNDPGFIDARKQLVEVDFQEGAGLALTDEGLKPARQLLGRAYTESDQVIRAALMQRNWMPFMTKDKFLADAYSMRAASIAALNTIEKRKPREQAKLAAEFKAALDEAVRLNPDGKLARDLLERYSKDGFN